MNTTKAERKQAYEWACKESERRLHERINQESDDLKGNHYDKSLAFESAGGARKELFIRSYITERGMLKSLYVVVVTNSEGITRNFPCKTIKQALTRYYVSSIH